MCQGSLIILTCPKALVYVMTLSFWTTFHEWSVEGSPSSIKDGSLVNAVSRELNRKRIVRGVMKEIEKGSSGSWSYSVVGNSVAFPRESPMSTLLKFSEFV